MIMLSCVPYTGYPRRKNALLTFPCGYSSLPSPAAQIALPQVTPLATFPPSPAVKHIRRDVSTVALMRSLLGIFSLLAAVAQGYAIGNRPLRGRGEGVARGRVLS
jgi:hypothetical protein